MPEVIQRLIILACLNVIFYAKTLRYRYVSDDLPNFKYPPETKNKYHKAWLWFIGHYKPCPKYDHILTLIVHATNVCLVYIALGATDISFLAALLFAFNPANNNGSVWISGRGYTLTLMSFLMVFIIPWLSPVFLFGTIWFGIGVINPLILLATKYRWLIVIALAIWAQQFKRQSSIYKQKRDIEAAHEDKKFYWKKIVLFTKTYGFYLALSLIPFRICCYHSFLQSCAGNDIMKNRAYTIKDKFFWFGATGLALTALSINTPYFFGFFWFFIGAAPFCNLMRINQEVSERFCYFPLVGLMYNLAILTINYPIAQAVFLTMYVVKMWFAMTMYRDDYYVLEYSVIEDPKAWYAWHMRALKRWGNQSYKEALTMWVMARLVNPKEFKLNMNIATMLFMLRKDKEAEAFLKIAEDNIIPGQEERARQCIKDTREGRYGVLS